MRIDLVESDDITTLRIAGRLGRDAAGQLESLCSKRAGPMTIDLEWLVSADNAGIEALRRLRAAGARLVRASPYIRLRLNGGPGEDGDSG